jgi:DnaJ-class molecular chaperone
MEHNAVLETACPECGGRGAWSSRGEREECPRCWGAGYIPTPMGEQILDLIRHNRATLREE